MQKFGCMVVFLFLLHDKTTGNLAFHTFSPSMPRICLRINFFVQFSTNQGSCFYTRFYTLSGLKTFENSLVNRITCLAPNYHVFISRRLSRSRNSRVIYVSGTCDSPSTYLLQITWLLLFYDIAM